MDDIEERLLAAQLVWEELNGLPEWVEDDYALIIEWKKARWTVFYMDDKQITLVPYNGMHGPVNNCKGEIDIYPEHRTWKSLLEEIASTEPMKVD